MFEKLFTILLSQLEYKIAFHSVFNSISRTICCHCTIKVTGILLLRLQAVLYTTARIIRICRLQRKYQELAVYADGSVHREKSSIASSAASATTPGIHLRMRAFLFYFHRRRRGRVSVFAYLMAPLLLIVPTAPRCSYAFQFHG
jgi:hypothetical protein